ncbi:hypothetical protein HYN86_06400 [Flavobacterium fluviale]|uniref:Uncharacterized protein n=1 Tax=Flavobacterium fluviale TaxID=2249356 RepID=A0A344LQQ8_9FLAO|nr:hypothetical protein HYN86_06400 [Flavobacterium fluviale]
MAFFQALFPAFRSNFLFFKGKNKKISTSIGAGFKQLASFKYFGISYCTKIHKVYKEQPKKSLRIS